MPMLLVKLHKAAPVPQSNKWMTVPLGTVVYEEGKEPWTELNGIWMEDVAELFDQDNSGPNSYGTAVYPWAVGAATVLGVVPTLEYWVCQGAEWDQVCAR